jgi:hypothetical protein
VVPVRKRPYWQKRDAEDAAYQAARAARPYAEYVSEQSAPVMQAEPDMYEMPEPMHMTMAPTPRPEERMAPHYSAPPSRPAAMSEYGAKPQQDDPRRMHLTREELDIAKSANLTPLEYAEQKLRLIQARKDDPDRYRSRG